MAFSLVVQTGAESGQEIELTPPEVLIGSAPVCQIVLSAPTVSRVHCRIATAGDTARVHDQASTNGTLVNGRLVEGQADLLPGDLLRVGPFEFRVRFDDSLSVMGREPRTADISGDTAELYQRHSNTTKRPPGCSTIVSCLASRASRRRAWARS